MAFLRRSNGEFIKCHKCDLYLTVGHGRKFEDLVHPNDKPMKEYPDVWFHIACFNRYEHYYGLDKPID